MFHTKFLRTVTASIYTQFQTAVKQTAHI